MTGYSTLQQDQLKKIGANLQEARVDQSKSIDDIAVQTYIRPQLLKAIEAGDVNDLPQPIFVQGFIRRYAEALGLDGKTLSKQFPVHSIPDTPRPYPQPAAKPFGASAMANPVIRSRPGISPASRSAQNLPPDSPPAERQQKSNQQPAIPVTQPAASASQPAAPTVRPAARITSDEAPIGDPPLTDADLERQTYGDNGIVPPRQNPTERTINRPTAVADRDPSSGNPMPYVLAGVLAFAVVGAIALLFNLGSNNTQQAQTEPAPEVTEPEAPAPVPEPEPEPLSPSAASDAPVAVSVSLNDGDSWMTIRVDDANVFEGLMTSGTEELYEGEESVYVRVGNAGAVELSYNGSEPEIAGPSGAVREFTYTP